MTYTVEADTLTQFGTNVLTALGVPNDDAHLLSDSLVVAELWGHSSHGHAPAPLVCGAAAQRRDGCRHPESRPSSTPEQWLFWRVTTASDRS